jgi:phage tail sheath gpL-like
VSLTGIAADDPRPMTARELIFGAGDAGAPNADMQVLFYGNKTSDGSETADSGVDDPVTSLADCVTKYGKRSELAWEYRKYTAVDKTARMSCAPVPEAGGSAAATVTFTFAAGAATVQTDLLIEWGGESTTASIAVGDDAATQAAEFAEAVNAASDASWPFTAAVGGGGSEHIVTVTCANKGPRHGLALAQLRARYLKATTTTVTKSAVTAGTGEDDFTDAYASAALGTYAIQINPKHATAAVSATDNGIGEGIDHVKAQSMPAVGKEQWMFFGLVGTQSEQAAVCQSAGANSIWGHFLWSENSPWTPGMLAAHLGAIARLNYSAHPSENLNGYSSDKGTFQIPAPYSKADWPTDIEVIAALKTGASPIAMDQLGRPFLVRHITSKCLDGATADYRQRSGHLAFAIRFAWLFFETKYRTTVKQRGIADNPLPGQKPQPNMTTPSAVEGCARTVIDELTSATPLGIYRGPILAPDKAAEMKAAVSVTKFAGGFLADLDFKAIEHLNKGLVRIRETSPSI